MTPRRHPRLGQQVRGYGTAEQPALAVVTAHRQQHVGLLLGLDAFRRDQQVMRVGEGAKLPPYKLFGAEEMRARLGEILSEGAGERDAGRGPAKYVRARHDASLRVGFITGSTDTYCSACDRLRVTAEGTLRPCLATNDGVAAMGLAQAGDVDGLVGAIADAWALKPDGETWKGCTEDTAAGVSMRATGG